VTHHHIKVEIEGPVASLVFNRPQVLNAFHNEAVDECRAALQELADDDRVRAILVRGEGRAFSAGFDMKASAGRDMSTVDLVRRQM
jgi:enoyl-CoA hydratase/carnithine racemase